VCTQKSKVSVGLPALSFSMRGGPRLLGMDHACPPADGLLVASATLREWHTLMNTLLPESSCTLRQKPG
jgi:hypothetical protein